jgi:putative phosphoribosyl transferase
MPQDSQIADRSVEISPAAIAADLRIPIDPKGLVIFAHGSGSSRLSSRNRFVAGVLERARFATLLLDLLTAKEEKIDVQTSICDSISICLRNAWLRRPNGPRRTTPSGAYFSFTLAQALELRRHSLQRQSFPKRYAPLSFAGDARIWLDQHFHRVKAPTLLIVGRDDAPVIELNEQALNQTSMPKKIGDCSRSNPSF